MTCLRRPWAWFYRRFHHPDSTLVPVAVPRKWTYCEMLGHQWGGWRRDSLGPFYSRRCRRRRCFAQQVATGELLTKNNAFYKGGKMWGVG